MSKLYQCLVHHCTFWEYLLVC